MAGVLRLTLSPLSARIALAVLIVIDLVALLGPYVSPYAFDDIVGTPFQGIAADHWPGTDHLGRDTFARFLYGGRTLLAVAILATSLAYVIAAPIGILSGLRRGCLTPH